MTGDNPDTPALESGWYTFPNLAAGDYIVIFDLTDLPLGYTVTTANATGSSGYNAGSNNEGNNDSDGVSGTGIATLNSSGTTITLPVSTDDPSWDLGISTSSSLGNYVWHDIDQDGIQDISEVGIAGVVVNLYYDSDGNGSVDNGEESTVFATTTTNAYGQYLFSNLDPGVYVVEVIPPNGMIVTQSDNTASGDYIAGVGGEGTNDSDIDSSFMSPTYGRTAEITLGSNQQDLTWDAGLYQPVSIGNFVWNDIDADGMYEPLGNDGVLSTADDEMPVAGVEVRLYAADGVTQITTDVFGNTFGTGGVITTLADGLYLFDNLLPGNYRVQFSIPTGGTLDNYVFTNQLDIVDNNQDDRSDADRIS
ncbi:MAG: hypothetical protein H6546_07085 [Chitinophagales bacterium]|nr:hypothetical protein [Chitinophagales bacterium]